MAHEISGKLNKLWVFAEIILFTLVGTQVNLGVVLQAGIASAVLICLGLIARSIGTYLCLLRSKLSISERMFVVISYIPKATVQAAIGGAPLIAMRMAGMNSQPGEIILAVAVLSILLTAPLGALAISIVGNRVLEVDHRIQRTAEQHATRDDVVSSMKVSEVMEKDLVIVRENEKLSKVFEFFSTYDFLIYPVVDRTNKLTGIVRLVDLRAILKEQNCWQWILAKDVLVPLKENIFASMRSEEHTSELQSH